MTLRPDQFLTKLRSSMMPKIDDARQKFLAKARKSAGASGGLLPGKPGASRAKVRTGRPVKPTT